MKCTSYQQFAIVTADSAQTLTDQLNAKLIELADKSPTVTFEGMIARISYTVSRKTLETLGDEYEERGVRLSCQDCPLYEPILKADGTIDQRIKWGNCPEALYGRTCRDAAACEKLFQMMNSGEVKLCLRSTE